MRFGLSLTLDRPSKRVVELVRRAEDNGFDVAWFPDHYFLRETYSAQALAALGTTTILLGTAVTSPFLRHPSLLASAAVSLDELADGRVIIGLGAGGHEFHANLGVPMDRPLTAVKEAVGIIKGLLTGGPVTFEGKVFSVKDARLPFTTRPDIPFYFAARGKRMLRLAGELGDGVLTHGVKPRFLEMVCESSRQSARAGGREPAAVEVGIMAPLVITEDIATARDRLRPQCVIMAGGDYSEEVVYLLDLETEKLAPLRASVRASEWARAPTLVTDEMVDAYCLIGSAELLREKLHQAEAIGVGQFIAAVGPNKSDEETAELIEQIGREIIARY